MAMAETKRFCDDLNEILIWGSTRIAKQVIIV